MRDDRNNEFLVARESQLRPNAERQFHSDANDDPRRTCLRGPRTSRGYTCVCVEHTCACAHMSLCMHTHERTRAAERKLHYFADDVRTFTYER